MADWAEFGLCAQLLSALSTIGWVSPKEIQAGTIPVVISDKKDVIGSAQTGSGKTGAFTLPMINELICMPEEDRPRFYGLIVSPTRDLTKQIATTIEQIVAATGEAIHTMTLIAGTDDDARLRAAISGPSPCNILVATPGSLLKVLEAGGDVVTGVRHLVLDEADELMAQNFRDTMIDIVTRLNADPTRPSRRSMLFSATIDGERKPGTRRLTDLVTRPDRVSVDVRDAPMPARLRHCRMAVPARVGRDWALNNTLLALPAGPPRPRQIVFVDTKIAAHRLAWFINEVAGEPQTIRAGEKYQPSGLRAVALHGDLKQRARDAATAQFIGRSANVLVATDVGARGLDFPDVALVVNHSVPQTRQHYTHRAGRTARNEAAGTVVTLLGRDDVARFMEIEGVLGVEMERMPAPAGTQPLRIMAAGKAADIATQKTWRGKMKGGKPKGVKRVSK